MGNIDDKMEAIKNACRYALDEKVVYIHQADGDRIREPNKPWGELAVVSLIPYGQDYVEDIETSDPDNPRQECIVAQRLVNFQFVIKSRSQKPLHAAYFLATRAAACFRYANIRDRYLKAENISLLSTSEVRNRPRVEGYDQRVESAAFLELLFMMPLTFEDETAVGTYIESVAVSSEGFPDPLNLDEEIIP